MKVIGLTGGIGSGKSTVGKYLAALGAVVIDLDRVGHELLRRQSPVYEKVLDRFGKNILNASGEIDRSRLSQLVFHDSKALGDLSRIMHPAIDDVVMRKIEEYRQKGVKVVVLEAAALLEAGKASLVDEIWVTTAPPAVVVKRLQERSGYSEEEIKARIAAQFPPEKRFSHADVVIDTGCSLDELRKRVTREWERLLKRIEQSP